MDSPHHAFEHGVEELAGLLRVSVSQKLHRSLQVGEENGDLLALAFQGGLGGEDLLGQMLGRVGLGRRKAWLRTGGDLLAKLGPTAVAKSTARRIDVATRGTRQPEACPAAVAEAGLGGVVLLALRAAHQASPLNSASACST